MAFNRDLDKEIWSETKEFETTRIKVGVFQYGEGEKKLQISRENRNANGEWTFSKMGRLFKDEVDAILPLMEKAKEKM